MSVTQSNTQSDSSADVSMNDMEKAIESMIATGGARGGGGGSAPLRVDRQAGAGGSMWGPTSQRVTSPLTMLAEVADHAQKLHEQMLSLTGLITGEAPPPLRLRASPRPGGGLLPNIGLLAHEIETVHAEIAGLIGHLRGRL